MQEKQRAFLVRTAYWAVWAVLLWLGVRYLLRWLLPFLLALALAAAVEPVIAWCRRRMGLKRGFTAAVVTIAGCTVSKPARAIRDPVTMISLPASASAGSMR